MLSKPIQDAINQQINAELASAYLYLSMSAHFEAANLPGSAAWMRRQSKEEAMKLFDYIHDQDGRVTLKPVAAPPAKFGSVVDVWRQTLEHEREVTERINALYHLAHKANDFATQAMLQWFVTEQVEEEQTARRILEQATMLGPSSTALFFFDRHLGGDAEG
jgi:ferritin